MLCFSFWKASVKRPSLSVNGIFWWRHIWRHLHEMVLQFGAKFCSGLIHWSAWMIRAKNYKAVFKFVKVMPRILWPFFLGHGIHVVETYSRIVTAYRPTRNQLVHIGSLDLLSVTMMFAPFWVIVYFVLPTIRIFLSVYFATHHDPCNGTKCTKCSCAYLPSRISLIHSSVCRRSTNIENKMLMVKREGGGMRDWLRYDSSSVRRISETIAAVSYIQRCVCGYHYTNLVLLHVRRRSARSQQSTRRSWYRKLASNPVCDLYWCYLIPRLCAS